MDIGGAGRMVLTAGIGAGGDGDEGGDRGGGDGEGDGEGSGEGEGGDAGKVGGAGWTSVGETGSRFNSAGDRTDGKAVGGV
jgi:hypothetical protein